MVWSIAALMGVAWGADRGIEPGVVAVAPVRSRSRRGGPGVGVGF